MTMARTMFEIEERIADLNAQVAAEAEDVVRMAGDAGAKMEDVRQKRARVSELQERVKLLQEERDRMHKAAQARLGGEGGAQMSRQEAAGLFYRAVLTDSVSTLPKMVYEQLGAKPDSPDQGNGQKLLPKTLSNNLLMEPTVSNPLRARMTVTNITGLRLPRLGFSVADDDFIDKDGATAKEVALQGDSVDFGRYELPLKATVSESLLRSSPLDIAAAVDAGLTSAQAAKELKQIFNAAPTAGEAHMSLYAKGTGESAGYLIKSVKGTTLLDAILAAAADLEDAYQAGACVVMRRQDYFGFIRDMVGADPLFGKKPEDVIGYPVIFCEKAVVPVVGDFRYLHLNFDGDNYFDTDKNVEKRTRIFTCNAEYDIQVVLRSAFRLAEVTA